MKRFQVTGDGQDASAPDYGRSARALSTQDLSDEVLLGKGDAKWLDAVRAELAVREDRAARAAAHDARLR